MTYQLLQHTPGNVQLRQEGDSQALTTGVATVTL